MEKVEFFLPTLDSSPTDEEVAQAEKIIEARKKALEKQKRNALITCSGNVRYGKGCGAHIPINTATYVQTYWYTPPHGCTEGDYWNLGEGQVICPKCRNTIRLYDSPEIVKLKKYFKEVKDTYTD